MTNDCEEKAQVRKKETPHEARSAWASEGLVTRNEVKYGREAEPDCKRAGLE